MKILRMPVFAILILSAVLYLVSYTCGAPPVKAEDTNSKGEPTQLNVPKDAKTDKKAVQVTRKSIELPHYPADFPPGKGKELFVSRCGVCHTLRYVTMQPNFPEKIWAKEVDKMIKTYGAHIDKKEAKEIVDYLNTIKGKSPSVNKQ